MRRSVDHLANLGQMAPLGHHHHAVVLAVIVVVLEQRAHMVDVDLLLRNQDHMRPAGHAGSISDPAGIAAHHFHHDHAVMRVGGGVNAVHGLGGDHHGSVEAEGRDLSR